MPTVHDQHATSPTSASGPPHLLGSIPSAVLQAALDSNEKEQSYISTKHAIELLGKDEELRKSTAKLFTAQDDVNELKEQVQHVEAGAERCRQLVEEHLSRAQLAEAQLEELQREMRCREAEVFRLATENQNLRDASNSTSTILTQKLALDRELSVLRPEAEHLRTQAGNAEQLMTDKLTLQRQLAETRCELEETKIEVTHARIKRRNSSKETLASLELDNVKKELEAERRAKEDAVHEVEMLHELYDGKTSVKHQLAEERRKRRAAEDKLIVAEDQAPQVDGLRKDLAKERKTNKRLEEKCNTLEAELEAEKQAMASAIERESAGKNDALQTVRDQLKIEKQARTVLEESVAKQQADWDKEKSHLQRQVFNLKEKTAELRTRESAVTLGSAQLSKAMANLGVAVAADIQSPAGDVKFVRTLLDNDEVVNAHVPTISELTLGTPGDKPKKNRKLAAAVGDKSTFSITPFLNKTSVINIDDENAGTDSPTVDPSPVHKQPLALAGSSKHNAQLKKEQLRKGKPKNNAPLQVVSEESSQQVLQAVQGEHVDIEPVVVENEQDTDTRTGVDAEATTSDAPATEAATTAPAGKRKPALRAKQKPRKSLTDFESFQVDDAKPVVKQKKRKLGARGPTLFDDDDGASDMLKPSHGLSGAAAYARLASVKKGMRTPGLGRSALGSAVDGTSVQFSPLKRSRKNLDSTLAG